MNELHISTSDWQRLKIKLKRKYNHLGEEDLLFQEGKEEALISHLMERLHRNRDYIVFTLKKGLANINTNRL
ncbi:MAG: hypothetical protein ACKOWL_00855 [Sphingobacteriaceae bacterium]